ncbi:MAG: cupin domain-containing protein [Gemmatimonadota bacterium]
MRRLGLGPAVRQDRPASELVHDEANVRVVAFHLLPGQEIPPHRSDSTVLVQVVAGSGTFTGDGSELELSAGDSAVFAPGELHAIRAPAVPLRFVAIITPRPGG